MRILILLAIIGIVLSTIITYVEHPWNNLSVREVNPLIRKYGSMGLVLSVIVSILTLVVSALVYRDDLPVTKLFLGIFAGIQFADGINDLLIVIGISSVYSIPISATMALVVPLLVLIRDGDILSIILYGAYLLGVGRLVYTAYSLL